MTDYDDPWMKEGGPAFPLSIAGDSAAQSYKGMSLRDYFAGQALMGMTSGITRFRDDAADIIVNRPQDISEIAYVYADAMLAERSKSSSKE